MRYLADGQDWHLFAGLESRHEGVGSVYEVPECFRGESSIALDYALRAHHTELPDLPLISDDWLNPPYIPDPRTQHCTPAARSADACSDFRFCYLGPAGTFTPLHRDVYASYSWSANVVGRKMWWFFPPDRLARVKDRHGDLVFDVRQLEDEGGAIKILQKVRSACRAGRARPRERMRLMAGGRGDLRPVGVAPSGSEPGLCGY